MNRLEVSLGLVNSEIEDADLMMAAAGTQLLSVSQQHYSDPLFYDLRLPLSRPSPLRVQVTESPSEELKNARIVPLGRLICNPATSKLFSEEQTYKFLDLINRVDVSCAERNATFRRLLPIAFRMCMYLFSPYSPYSAARTGGRSPCLTAPEESMWPRDRLLRDVDLATHLFSFVPISNFDPLSPSLAAVLIYVQTMTRDFVSVKVHLQWLRECVSVWPFAKPLLHGLEAFFTNMLPLSSHPQSVDAETIGHLQSRFIRAQERNCLFEADHAFDDINSDAKRSHRHLSFSDYPFSACESPAMLAVATTAAPPPTPSLVPSFETTTRELGMSWLALCDSTGTHDQALSAGVLSLPPELRLFTDSMAESPPKPAGLLV